jgi:hypothetical protein
MPLLSCTVLVLYRTDHLSLIVGLPKLYKYELEMLPPVIFRLWLTIYHNRLYHVAFETAARLACDHLLHQRPLAIDRAGW